MTEQGDDRPEPHQLSRLAELANAPADAPAGVAVAPVQPKPEPDPEPRPIDEAAATTRREFARLLGEFRRTAVLVPFDDHDSLWTADFNGVRWICAFSDEEALARFAVARGDAAREWTYRTVLGARLLDVMVPMLPGPGGVALDAGSADGADDSGRFDEHVVVRRGGPPYGTDVLRPDAGLHPRRRRP